MPATVEQPVGNTRTAPTYSINHNGAKDAGPEKDAGQLLSAGTHGRAVGRVRVYYASHPGIDILEAVLAGLRRL
nr:hypothetical protein [Salinispora vitiensis]